MMEMNPIKMLTDALAEMTVRAMEAEAELEKAQRRADEWFSTCMVERNKSADLQAKLDAANELREQAKQGLQEEKDAHAETWRMCTEAMNAAVKAGIPREKIEALIYGKEALEEIRGEGDGDAE